MTSTTPTLGSALRRLIHQAWPVLVGQWAGVAFGVLDTAMTGHASPVDLAAMALAVSIYITVFVGLMGILHALIPVMAQHFGAGRLHDVGSAWGQGIWLALGLSVLGAVILFHPDPWFNLTGSEDIDPAVRERVTGYLLALSCALPAALIYRTMHAVGTAVSRPKVIMWINLGGVGLKGGLNWLLIFGNLGLPALGAVGAGIATAIVFWVSALVGALVLIKDSHFHPLRLRLERPHWPTLRELLRLGIPMGGSYLIEVISFTFMALLVAREGVLVTGAHQITANLAALCYMAPMAIGIATSAQTAQTLGSGQLALTQRMALAGTLLTVGAAIITVSLLWSLGGWIIAIYTNDLQVALIAMSLLAIMPFFHVADAAQTLVVFLLRAYKVAVAPLVVQIVALGGVGLLGGWWLAFGGGAGKLEPVLRWWSPTAPLGAGTLWIMATTGMVLSLCLLAPIYFIVERRYRAGHTEGIPA